MGYLTKKRYTSRRERYEKSKKNAKIIAVFAVIFFAVWLFMNRIWIYDYIRIWWRG